MHQDACQASVAPGVYLEGLLTQVFYAELCQMTEDPGRERTLEVEKWEVAVGA